MVSAISFLRNPSVVVSVATVISTGGGSLGSLRPLPPSLRSQRLSERVGFGGGGPRFCISVLLAAGGFIKRPSPPFSGAKVVRYEPFSAYCIPTLPKNRTFLQTERVWAGPRFRVSGFLAAGVGISQGALLSQRLSERRGLGRPTVLSQRPFGRRGSGFPKGPAPPGLPASSGTRPAWRPGRQR